MPKMTIPLEMKIYLYPNKTIQEKDCPQTVLAKVLFEALTLFLWQK
jgi:hypothetical protein